MRTMSPQGHCGERVLLAQQSKQQMLGANMPLSQSFRFLRGKVQHALALDGEWHFGRSGKAFAALDLLFNLLLDCMGRDSRTHHIAQQRKILAHQT